MRIQLWVPQDQGTQGLIHLWSTRSQPEAAGIEVFSPFGDKLSEFSVALGPYMPECIDLRDFVTMAPLYKGFRFLRVSLDLPEGFHVRQQVLRTVAGNALCSSARSGVLAGSEVLGRSEVRRPSMVSFWPAPMQSLSAGKRLYIPIRYEKDSFHILTCAAGEREAVLKIRLMLDKRNPEVELFLRANTTEVIHIESEFLENLAPLAFDQTLYIRATSLSDFPVSVKILDHFLVPQNAALKSQRDDLNSEGDRTERVAHL